MAIGDLVVEKLSVGIPGSGACHLRDVSFVLPAGNSKALIGRSGSGKSLLAASLVQLLRPPLAVAGGRALLGDINLLSADARTLRTLRGSGIFLIFQGLALLSPCLSIRDQVRRAAARRSAADADQRALNALAEVGLSEVAGRYPFQLSGGMRQRVLLAMAFALEPQVLIADEPTTGLDPCTQSEILKNLEKLVSRTGASLLLITHDLRAAGALCRDTLVLHDGVVVAEGSWAQLQRDKSALDVILQASQELET